MQKAKQNTKIIHNNKNHTKNELIIRIICNRTNIKVEKIGGTMPEDLPTPEKSI